MLPWLPLYYIVPRVAPTIVSATPNDRSINLSWMMLECQDRRGNITMYEVRYIRSDGVSQTENTTSGDDTSLLVDGLEEFTNYTIKVRAYTAVGPGPYSSPIEVMTLTDGKHVVYVCIGIFEECKESLLPNLLFILPYYKETTYT